MSTMFTRRRYHVMQVMAWGYTKAAAFELCKQNEWFGDAVARGLK